MKHYDSIPRIQDDGILKGETVWGYNKLDGQNFCVTYRPKKGEFGPFGSRTRTVDENDIQFGGAVKYSFTNLVPVFNIKTIENSKGKVLFNIVTTGQLTNGVDKSFVNFKLKSIKKSPIYGS